MVELRRGTLSGLDVRVNVPSYNRDKITPGIAHISVGGFHRAHQAVYLDRLFGQGLAHDWGIVGIGVMPQDRAMRDALAAQDHLYTVVEKHADGGLAPRVVGSIIDYRWADEDTEAVLAVLGDPAIRIVSLTITEGGYHDNQITGELELDDDLRADLVSGAAPRTAFGLIVEALSRRREAGVPAFTVMSCDNVPSNGVLTRRVISSFASLRDADLGEWIESEVHFPNSMVDRITPVTTDDDRVLVATEFGIDDRWPVVCEPYLQWVLEDDFESGRPPLEDVGVQLVDNVIPYELMKMRLLNASHGAMAHLGYLAGYRYAHEVCREPAFVELLSGYMEKEATPTLPAVPGVDLVDYRRQLIERFANPQVLDTMPRLSADASDGFPKFLVPVIAHQLKAGGDVHRSALVIAAWARYAEGVDEQGRPIEVVDRRVEAICAAARHSLTDPVAFLADRTLFGELQDSPRFVRLFTAALKHLRERGARATVECWAGDEPATL
ncbi:MAG: mannitol dehydrogenase family protein [Nocardioidaceae bacterium]